MFYEQRDKNYVMLQENGERLGYCAASGDSFLPTFRFNTSYAFSRIKNTNEKYLTIEDGIDIFFRDVATKLSLLAA